MSREHRKHAERSRSPFLHAEDGIRDELIYELVELGAKGFLQKNANIEEVVDAIYTLYDNGSHFSSDISMRVVKKLVKKENKKRLALNEGLTEGEKEIIRLLCDEYS